MSSRVDLALVSDATTPWSSLFRLAEYAFVVSQFCPLRGDEAVHIVEFGAPVEEMSKKYEKRSTDSGERL